MGEDFFAFRESLGMKVLWCLFFQFRVMLQLELSQEMRPLSP